MIDTFAYTEKKSLRIIRLCGEYTFGILAILMVICTVIGLIRMAANSGDIDAKDYYRPYDYQEFLVNNPGYKLNINNRAITEYERPEMKMPLVIELSMSNDKVYKILVKKENTWIPIIVKKLYIQAADN